MYKFEPIDIAIFVILCFAFFEPVRFSEWLAVIAGPFISP